MNGTWFGYLLASVVVFAGVSSAESSVPSQSEGARGALWRPSLQIAPVVQLSSLRGEMVTLGDVATFQEGAEEFKPLVETLKAIPLATPPGPGMRTTLLGTLVLEKIHTAGITPDSFGYSLPQVITVDRPGREVTKDEVLQAAKEVVWGEKHLDVQVRDVTWGNKQAIPVGKTTVTAERVGEPNRGGVPLRIEVVVDGRPAARFLATAAVDDWQEVPVITRELQRGTVIGAGDVQMVRLNLSQYSGEIIRDLSEAVGQRAKGRIGAGEVIRRSLVDLPPTIVRGAKVKAIYKKGALTAVLNSVAVEDGFLGEEMRIKNESSKKVLTGRVLSGEEVEVTE